MLETATTDEQLRLIYIRVRKERAAVFTKFLGRIFAFTRPKRKEAALIRRPLASNCPA